MQIRRSFGFCASHVVRNCTSKRCATSIHGHNYTLEVFIEAHKFDYAGMLLDFGIFKQEIASFIDAFDHAHHFWDQESPEFQDFITTHSARYAKLSFNPSAEGYALMFHFFLNAILQATTLQNAEAPLSVSSVRVHETNYGYAQSFLEDLHNPDLMAGIGLHSVQFSPAILQDLPNPLLLEQLKNYHANPKSPKPFKSPPPLRQI
ncbi:6-pyruvoyl trahydropterin synthase family protein [Helicobacter bizzozeronii]|uniref:6-carboxy-5,6,7,8-tetrahydropterin synthase n=2 Tax=Helicobacter bizzozeronii TaxID=56877 RepID=F8KRX1_HELBC|nr:6-carboxytetrahydropterin synthase [Helicobacter bizzozeronii]CCB79520.1 queuosine biosynthesis QueD, PTPS-I [Helicobacter bizzozeronii CIII-1]